MLSISIVLLRQDVTAAQKLRIEILELGLTLVTGMAKRSFTLKSVNQHPTELMISILMFSRSHEENKTKKNHTISNIKALVERHREGKPVNIKSCGKHPLSSMRSYSKINYTINEITKISI